MLNRIYMQNKKKKKSTNRILSFFVLKCLSVCLSEYTELTPIYNKNYIQFLLLLINIFLMIGSFVFFFLLPLFKNDSFLMCLHVYESKKKKITNKNATIQLCVCLSLVIYGNF